MIAPLPWGIQLATIVSLRNGNPWDVTAGVDLDRDGNNQDRPAGLVKNSGGRESEGNLAIINAFRQSRNLAPDHDGAAGAHLAATGSSTCGPPSSSRIGSRAAARGVPRGLQPAQHRELREPERRHHLGQLRQPTPPPATPGRSSGGRASSSEPPDGPGAVDGEGRLRGRRGQPHDRSASGQLTRSVTVRSDPSVGVTHRNPSDMTSKHE